MAGAGLIAASLAACDPSLDMVGRDLARFAVTLPGCVEVNVSGALGLWSGRLEGRRDCMTQWRRALANNSQVICSDVDDACVAHEGRGTLMIVFDSATGAQVSYRR